MSLESIVLLSSKIMGYSKLKRSS